MPAFTADERTLLMESLDDFFSARYPFERFRKLSAREHPDGYGREEWAAYAELGWLGVALPERAGGSGGGLTELAIVMASAGRALAMEPLVSTLVMGAGAIERAGSATQQSLLAEIGRGALTISWCHTEPGAGYARAYVRTTASVTGDGFVLSGEKSFTLHAHNAERLLVSARLGGEDGPLALFVVPAESEGIHRKVASFLDGRRGAALTLRNVEVPAEALLGEASGGTVADRTELIESLIDRGALAVCAEAAGAMAAVTEQTVAYLKTREQFGQPLSRFQVLQHRMVDMSLSAEEARAATHSALNAHDGGDPDVRLKIWRAKVQTARSARFVGGQAIQLHGGMGMTDELAIGHYYKRLTVCEHLFGDGEWYLRQLAAGACAAA